MQITAKLVQILPLEKGMGKNGEWKKQSLILETDGQYPKKICVSVWGDKADPSILQLEKNLVVDFDIESREYNGRWYTDVKAWKIELAGAKNNAQVPVTSGPPSFDSYAMPEPPLEPQQNNWSDDMPF
ncbi:DUF3127 domain-containing protein [Bacteroidales bacterium OttesenSCG-928-M11]|nr:DUF3127 domain-containing protein [Bacteroidales bacterium OttesenSCG-928-M11]